jgi:hypothetical protein
MPGMMQSVCHRIDLGRERSMAAASCFKAGTLTANKNEGPNRGKRSGPRQPSSGAVAHAAKGSMGPQARRLLIRDKGHQLEMPPFRNKFHGAPAVIQPFRRSQVRAGATSGPARRYRRDHTAGRLGCRWSGIEGPVARLARPFQRRE